MSDKILNSQFYSLLKKGDYKAMTQAVRQELPRIYNLCLRLCHDSTEAEDLCQDVFVRALKGFSRFNGQSQLSTWLYTVTVNTWKNKVRAEKSRHRLDHVSIEINENSDENPQEIQLIDSSMKPDQIAESKEIANQIYLALDQLNPEERSIIVLRDVQNLSYEDISLITGLNSGTVKSRLFRARESLRTIWKSLQ